MALLVAVVAAVVAVADDAVVPRARVNAEALLARKAHDVSPCRTLVNVGSHGGDADPRTVAAATATDDAVVYPVHAAFTSSADRDASYVDTFPLLVAGQLQPPAQSFAARAYVQFRVSDVALALHHAGIENATASVRDYGATSTAKLFIVLRAHTVGNAFVEDVHTINMYAVANMSSVPRALQRVTWNNQPQPHGLRLSVFPVAHHARWHAVARTVVADVAMALAARPPLRELTYVLTSSVDDENGDGRVSFAHRGISLVACAPTPPPPPPPSSSSGNASAATAPAATSTPPRTWLLAGAAAAVLFVCGVCAFVWCSISRRY